MPLWQLQAGPHQEYQRQSAKRWSLQAHPKGTRGWRGLLPVVWLHMQHRLHAVRQWLRYGYHELVCQSFRDRPQQDETQVHLLVIRGCFEKRLYGRVFDREYCVIYPKQQLLFPLSANLANHSFPLLVLAGSRWPSCQIIKKERGERLSVL